jgi:phosphoglycolate phosphatase
MGAIVFDLDGTLVDSAPDIAAAANRMLADFGHKALPLAQLTGFVGHGVPALVRQVIEACDLDPVLHPEMTDRMLAHYAAHPAEQTRIYPGVLEALATLHAAGHRLGVCTNKVHGLSVRILEAMGLSDWFDVVIGGDSLPVRKPDPAPLTAAFAGLNAAPLLYVGDSEVDAQTAVNARLDFALFTEGYRQAPVSALRHSFAFDRFADLPPFVARLAQDSLAAPG